MHCSPNHTPPPCLAECNKMAAARTDIDRPSPATRNSTKSFTDTPGCSQRTAPHRKRQHDLTSKRPSTDIREGRPSRSSIQTPTSPQGSRCSTGLQLPRIKCQSVSAVQKTNLHPSGNSLHIVCRCTVSQARQGHTRLDAVTCDNGNLSKPPSRAQ